MPLTGAERARLYRQRKKENPHEYAAYLQKEKKRYHKRKVEGQIRSINDMTEREKKAYKKSMAKEETKRNKRKKKKIHRITTRNTSIYTIRAIPNKLNKCRSKKSQQR